MLTTVKGEQLSNLRVMASLDDISKWLGVVGGITGPVGLAIAYLTYKRDAGRLRIRVRRNSIITQGPEDDEKVRSALRQFSAIGKPPPMDLYTRDPDKTWALVEVTNVGRRPVRLQQIGWKVIGAKYQLPAGFFGYEGSAPWLPRDLGEGQEIDFPIEDSSLEDAGYLFARTSTGYAYGGFAKGWRGIRYRISTSFKSLWKR